MLLQIHKEKCMFCDKTLEQINSEIEKIEKQSKLLTTKLLEGVIDDITYKEMKTEFSIKLDKLELEKDKIKEIPKSFSYYVENLLELCKDAPHLWKTAEPLKKRELLKIVCSNLQIKDRKLIETLAPPFSQLSKIKINGQNLHSVHVSGASGTKLEPLTDPLRAKRKQPIFNTFQLLSQFVRIIVFLMFYPNLHFYWLAEFVIIYQNCCNKNVTRFCFPLN